jgi:hypothetical protein
MLTGKPYSNIVSTILYIYSLETFLPKAVNDASRERNVEKIDSLGPIAKVLMLIVGYSNSWRGDAILGEVKCWRGLKLMH